MESLVNDIIVDKDEVVLSDEISVVHWFSSSAETVVLGTEVVVGSSVVVISSVVVVVAKVSSSSSTYGIRKGLKRKLMIKGLQRREG